MSLTLLSDSLMTRLTKVDAAAIIVVYRTAELDYIPETNLSRQQDFVSIG